MADMRVFATDPELTTSCPRCGYDLRGTVATWMESCPLSGVCAECGLAFEWGEVYDPGRTAPGWCIEFAQRGGVEGSGIVRAAASTAFRTLFFWWFWKQLRLSHPVNPPRLCAYIALLILPLILMYALWQASLALHVRGLIERDIAMFRQMAQAELARMQSTLARATSVSPEWAAQLERDAELRAQQNEQVRNLKNRIARQQVALATPATIDLAPERAVIEAVLFPFAEHSWGSIRDLPRRNVARLHPYPAPSQLYAASASDSGIVIGTTGGLWPRSGEAMGVMNFVRWSVLWQAFSWGLFILMPLMMLALPASRRRAKIRWAHIGRVLAYSIIVPVGLVVVSTLAGCAAMFIDGVRAELLRTYALHVQHFGPWILLPAWWACAIGLYLRIPRGWLIAPVLATLALLLMLGLIGLLDRDFLIMISDDLM